MYRSSPSVPAMTSAAMVLPVPDSPAKSAIRPLPIASRLPRPHTSYTMCRCSTWAHISRAVAARRRQARCHPMVMRHHLPREVAQDRRGLRARGDIEVLHADGGVGGVAPGGESACPPNRIFDAAVPSRNFPATASRSSALTLVSSAARPARPRAGQRSPARESRPRHPATKRLLRRHRSPAPRTAPLAGVREALGDP